MTLPSQRYRAINEAREFLRLLIVPKLAPGVPKPIRDAALRLLRHFPLEMDVAEMKEREDASNKPSRTRRKAPRV